MEQLDFRVRIPLWRESARLTQEELDEACGFKPGTVGRLEQRRLKLTGEQLVRIVIFTGRDLLWTLAEGFGALYKELEPLERRQRSALEMPAAVEDLPADPEFDEGLQALLSGAGVVFRKMARVGDERRWFADFLLRAAGTDEVRRKGRRVRKARRPVE